jgi:hypothetical protein
MINMTTRVMTEIIYALLKKKYGEKVVSELEDTSVGSGQILLEMESGNYLVTISNFD